MILIMLQNHHDGDNSVDELFEKHNIHLFNISFKILRSHTDAEEAVARTFLKILENSKKIFKLPCHKVLPYCIVMVKNESLMIIRSRKKHITFDEAFVQDFEADSDIWDAIITDEEQELLKSNIDALSEDDRTFIHLRYYEGMSYSDIADFFGITEDSARKRNSRIIKRLKNLYKEDYNLE
ncbi:MAG: sigma-70 family RNA polymerase sigma factor [Oscillospiraceae bacterium]|nr:sigma-70 family RNA polymerase sigma factor [Oscillospiraceae bacterium]